MSTTDPTRRLPADRLAPAVAEGTLRSIEASNGPATAGVVAILLVSALATAFLLWLLYLHHPPAEYRHRLLFLPLLNAVLKEYGAFKMLTGVKTMGQVRAISRVRYPYPQLTSHSLWRTCDSPCRLTTLG